MEYNLDQARLWFRDTLPTERPLGFLVNRDLLITDAGDSYIWVSLTNAWVKVTNPLKGKDGAVGPMGPVGLIGPTGPKGDMGLQGPIGPMGPQGPQGEPGTSGGTGIPTVVGKKRFVYTEADFRSALNAHATGACNSIEVCDNIALTASLDLPKSTTSLSKQLVIDLGGNTISDGSSAGLPYLIGRIPSDQTEALNTMQSWALVLQNGALRGKTGTGTLVQLGATFNSRLVSLRLDNANVGIWLKFCLMTKVENVVTAGISNESFFIDRGDWTNATMSNSQSNHTELDNCRVFNKGGNFAAYRVRGCSGIEIGNSISEGASPQWHIYFDSQANTVVKDFKLNKIHIESPATLGGVYFRMSAGAANIDGVYSLYDNNLFVAESAGGPAELNIKNVPWLTSGTKFQSIGNTKWTFEDVYDGANVLNATRWVNGTLPSAGQSTFWSGNTRTTINK